MPVNFGTQAFSNALASVPQSRPSNALGDILKMKREDEETARIQGNQERQLGIAETNSKMNTLSTLGQFAEKLNLDDITPLIGFLPPGTVNEGDVKNFNKVLKASKFQGGINTVLENLQGALGNEKLDSQGRNEMFQLGRSQLMDIKLDLLRQIGPNGEITEDMVPLIQAAQQAERKLVETFGQSMIIGEAELREEERKRDDKLTFFEDKERIKKRLGTAGGTRFNIQFGPENKGIDESGKTVREPFSAAAGLGPEGKGYVLASTNAEAQKRAVDAASMISGIRRLNKATEWIVAKGGDKSEKGLVGKALDFAGDAAGYEGDFGSYLSTKLGESDNELLQGKFGTIPIVAYKSFSDQLVIDMIKAATGAQATDREREFILALMPSASEWTLSPSLAAAKWNALISRSVDRYVATLPSQIQEETRTRAENDLLYKFKGADGVELSEDFKMGLELTFEGNFPDPEDEGAVGGGQQGGGGLRSAVPSSITITGEEGAQSLLVK